ncbi:MAG TPA: M48 family metalloprotease [Phycisphaerae bacterium]|nr:M48 family metalloprotease [Phycisphaerae bacterium]
MPARDTTPTAAERITCLPLRWVIFYHLTELLFLAGVAACDRILFASPAPHGIEEWHQNVLGPICFFLGGCAAYAFVMLAELYCAARRLDRRVGQASPPMRPGLILRLGSMPARKIFRAFVLLLAILWPYAFGVPFWPAVSLGVMLVYNLASDWGQHHLQPAPRQVQAQLAAEAEPTPPADELTALAQANGARDAKVVVHADDELLGLPDAGYDLWKGRPVFIFSRHLTDRLNSRQLRAVFAHELAHHLLRHLRGSALLTIAADLLAVAVGCMAAVRFAAPRESFWHLAHAAPLVLLSWALAHAMIWPLKCWHWRRQERAADRKALEITHDPAALISAIRSLAQDGAALEQPAGWIGRVLTPAPTMEQKIALAEQYAARHRITLSGQTTRGISGDL